MAKMDDAQATMEEPAGEPEQLLAALQQGEITYREVGERIGVMLQHAYDWAEQMVAEASAEATRMRASAKDTSKKKVNDAENEARKIVSDARAEAVRRIEHALSRIEELKGSVELARLRTDSLKARLRGVLEQLEDHDYDVGLPPDLPELPEEVDDEERVDESAEASTPQEVGPRGSG